MNLPGKGCQRDRGRSHGRRVRLCYYCMRQSAELGWSQGCLHMQVLDSVGFLIPLSIDQPHITTLVRLDIRRSIDELARIWASRCRAVQDDFDELSHCKQLYFCQLVVAGKMRC